MSARSNRAPRAAHRRAVSSQLRLQLRRARRATVVIALAALTALAVGIDLLSHESGGIPLGGKTVVRVAVDSAKGVVPGDDEVRWAGVVVGRITAVGLRQGRAVLTAEIDPGVARPLYRNAVLELRPATPLQDMYLDIVNPGTPSAGRLRSGEVLGAERTRTSVDVAEVLDVFSVSVRDRFQRALDELSVGLPDQGSQLREAFVELVPFLRAAQRLAAAIAAKDDVTRELIDRVRLIVDQLAARSRAIAQLVRVAGATFGTLGGQQASLDSMMRQLPPALTQLRASLSQLQLTLATARPALVALRPAARALPSGLTALRSLAGQLYPALSALLPAVSALEPLASQLDPTANSLRSAFSRLLPELPELDRITAKVSRCELPLQKFFAWTMSVLKFANRDNLTSSPRGVLVVPVADLTNGVDPFLVPVSSCADGSLTPPP